MTNIQQFGTYKTETMSQRYRKNEKEKYQFVVFTNPDNFVKWWTQRSKKKCLCAFIIYLFILCRFFFSFNICHHIFLHIHNVNWMKLKSSPIKRPEKKKEKTTSHRFLDGAPLTFTLHLVTEPMNGALIWNELHFLFPF